MHSVDEKQFFSKILFRTLNVVDTIRIGANNSNENFKWVGNSELKFTNWAPGSLSNISDNAFVQMIPDGASMGKLVDEPCKKISCL